MPRYNKDNKIAGMLEKAVTSEGSSSLWKSFEKAEDGYFRHNDLVLQNKDNQIKSLSPKYIVIGDIIYEQDETSRTPAYKIVQNEGNCLKIAPISVWRFETSTCKTPAGIQYKTITGEYYSKITDVPIYKKNVLMDQIITVPMVTSI